MIEQPVMKETTVYSSESGIRYAKMMIPEGWPISINHSGEYRGRGYPAYFSLKFTSPDKTCMIRYVSPIRYMDDYLENYQNDTVDDYGRLMHSFQNLEQYGEAMAIREVGNYENFRFLKQVDYSGNKKRYEENKAKIIRELKEENSDLQLSDYYYKGAVRQYGYTHNNYSRSRDYAMVIEGAQYIFWALVPGMQINDPYFISISRSVFPNMQRRNDGKYVYTSQYYMNWMARGIFLLDCLEKDHETVYQKVLIPMINYGTVIHDDVWEIFRQKQEEVDARDRSTREEKKKAAEITRKAEEERRESNKQLYDYIRKTQQEIHDIQNSAWENHNRTQDKVREMRSDAILGNTRYVDRYGKEYVVHSTDRYAYKKGDTIVTGNSPLDRPFGFEELEKKKY